MPDEVEVVSDTEIDKEVIKLIHEELNGPELWGYIFEMGRLADADLVVENDGSVVRCGEGGVREHIVMRYPGTAMKSHQRAVFRAEIAYNLVPRLIGDTIVREWDLSGSLRHYSERERRYTQL